MWRLPPGSLSSSALAANAARIASPVAASTVTGPTGEFGHEPAVARDRPLAPRYSMAHVPSLDPAQSRRSPRTSARSSARSCRRLQARARETRSSAPPPRCARASTGHAAAAHPSSVMNSRLIHSITSSARASSDVGTLEAERLGGLEINGELELCGLQTREGQRASSPLRTRPT